MLSLCLILRNVRLYGCWEGFLGEVRSKMGLREEQSSPGGVGGPRSSGLVARAQP